MYIPIYEVLVVHQCYCLVIQEFWSTKLVRLQHTVVTREGRA